MWVKNSLSSVLVSREKVESLLGFPKRLDKEKNKLISFFAEKRRKLSCKGYTLEFLHEIYKDCNISIDEAEVTAKSDSEVIHSEIYEKNGELVVTLDRYIRKIGVKSLERDVLMYELLHFIIEPEKLKRGEVLRCSSLPNEIIDRYYFDIKNIAFSSK